MSIQTLSSVPTSTAPTLAPAPPGVAQGLERSASAKAASDVSAAAPGSALDAAEKAGTAKAAPASLEDVRSAMDEVRAAIAPVAQDLLFSIDEDTGKTIVKVVDASTDEVIRQIPSEEIISIAKALDKLQGLLLKQEA